MKEYKVMMKRNGKWWTAHVNCRNGCITGTYEDAVKEMNRIMKGRIAYGHPADDYKIVCRDVTEWTDA